MFFCGGEEEWRGKIRENAWKRKMSLTREGRAVEQGTLEGRDEQFRDSSGDQRSLTLASRLF